MRHQPIYRFILPYSRQMRCRNCMLKIIIMKGIEDDRLNSDTSLVKISDDELNQVSPLLHTL